MKITKKEFKELLKELKTGSVIRITDYSEHDPGKSVTGGAYSYTERYKKLENGKFEVEYSTSSAFHYCPFCGQFTSGECNCYEEYEQISLEEFAEILEYAWYAPNYGVYVK